jgi:hypothetical protein
MESAMSAGVGAAISEVPESRIVLELLSRFQK